jgi:glycosyltransferase involved in cell wall biosynthesis
MKKIVVDARESGTSTGRYVDKLIKNMHLLKPPEFDFIVLTKPQRLNYLKSIAPNFKIIESAYKEFTFSEQIGFLRQLLSQKADLVHFTMTQQPAFYRGKTITTIHDLTTIRFRNPAKNRLLFFTKQAVYKWLIKRVARKSVMVITPSQFVKNDVAQYAKISPEKIRVIYEAADRIADPPKSVPNLLPGSFILYVGRSLPHKNLDKLIEAYGIVSQTFPKISLVIAGKKDVLFEKLENDILQKNIKGVVFTGFVSEGQLRWLYENTLAYVFPSLSEGFGLPGLEAMVHGAPVIASKATCLPEIYGDAALYFDPQDTTDMAEKITLVLKDGQLAKSMVQKGIQQAQKYSWQQTAEQTLAAYRYVLNDRL